MSKLFLNRPFACTGGNRNILKLKLANRWRVSVSVSTNVMLMGPCTSRPEEIDGLLVPPGRASNLLTDHLITGYPLMSELAQEMCFRQTIHTYKPYWLS